LAAELNILQEPRLLEISSPLGPGVLTLRRLSVQEEIGRPFTLAAEVVSENLDIEAKALIGQPITCKVKVKHTAARYFHGIVRSFSRLGPYGRGLAAYRIEAAPRLWQLSRTGDCRIFQEVKARDIVTTVLGEAQAVPVRWGGSVPSEVRTYCVQFNETDLDFVQRLFDEMGCGYFFEHKDGDHTLVVCGANSDYPLVPGDPQVVRNDPDMHGALTHWRPVSSLQPGKVAAEDFDGLKPSTLLSKNAPTVLRTPDASRYEIFRWPSGQAVRPEGDLAKRGMEGFEAGADQVTATGNDPTIFAGGRLKVRPGLDAPQPVTWLVSSATHEAFDETHLSGGGVSGYSNSIVLIAGDRPWRPPAPRPRPPMLGVHSAIVTGPSGEEIHCDEYGRVKVHFLWDRAGKKDDTASCWVRVAQSFSGKWGGSWTLPRVGDEVLVAFVDGDPDRPVVIGSVYNAEQKPIYALPANKTQSGFKTKSSKGGGASNFNELRFEDKRGSEEIHVQAERDMTLLIKRNRREDVWVNRTETVGGKHTETVTEDRTATITKGNESLTVKMGKMDTLVEMGNITTKASLGKIEIEAMQSITLKVGMSKIHMTPTSISIESLQIDVKAQLALNSEGLMATHKAGAIMTIKGGLVLIN
jgi:type VI secretion system secreted protein VgrG